MMKTTLLLVTVAALGAAPVSIQPTGSISPGFHVLSKNGWSGP